ncbi:tRNA nucleotidyltransferase [Metarhizium rileyi]|uniref:tRNA nucleotidyltransferase n=1 Tax=Metarhizium rileyi (strain RCEF 4871) TaxID=1649241 RepID=A0A167G7Y6_METRR|nr:tRNA nucleotidyltransferase [Metarhizium rileyi RCEF 4871]
MGEISLSKENVRILGDLGFQGVAAAVVPLPGVRCNGHGLTPYDASISPLVTLDEAMKKLPRASNNKTRLEIVLRIYACLVLHSATVECSFDGADVRRRDFDNIDLGQDDCSNPLTKWSEKSLYDDVSQTLTSCILHGPKPHDKEYTALLSEAALASLALLSSRLQDLKLPLSTLIAVTAHTDPHDLWTTKFGTILAQRVLASQIPGKRLADFITGPVLNQHIRVMVPSPNASGYSAYLSEFGSIAASNLAEHEHTAAVLHWAIRMTEETNIAKHWHLFVPALLSLAESHETPVKVRGLRAIILFLAKCPSSTIFATGIDQLFERTILPTLLLLPTMTPEKESVTLLELGYTAALKLASASGNSHNFKGRRLLDALVRDGLLAGFRHASNYVLVVDVLMNYLGKVVSCLGLFSVKYLADLLDVIESVLCDPFYTDRLEGLISATDALIVIITNCWPSCTFKPTSEQSIQNLKSRILRVACSVRRFTQYDAMDVEGTSRVAIAHDGRLQGLLIE